VQVRMPPAELASLDDWIAHQDNAPTRPEAIRRLVERAIDADSSARLGKKSVRKTTQTSGPGGKR
jgi:hypothetical protein